MGPAACSRGMGCTWGRTSQWGAIVGKETKFGLLVGVAFIVLFGVILGGRVGSAAGDHAPLPVGDSGGHQVLVDTILGSDDPLEADRRLLAMDEPPADAEDAGPPAPEEAAPPAAESVEPAPTGRLAMAPARVETPMPMPDRAETPRLRDDPAESATPDPAPPAPEPEPVSPPAPKRPVHIVAKGETLTTIARQYYGADGARLWRRIWEANKDRLADPHRLDLGQSLVIPGLPAEPAPAATRTADASDASGAGTPAESADEAEEAASVTLDDLARRFKVRLDEGEVTPDPAAPPPTYTVRKGDTFYSIAQKVYGDPSLAGKLAQKNRDRAPDARRLRVGQAILLLEDVQSAGATEATEERVAQVASR